MHEREEPLALDEQIRRAARVIAGGGVVAYPTDTLYGLAADPRVDGALARLFDVKGRPAERTVPLIAADLDQVAAVAFLGPLAERLAAAFWPGPLTLVLQARPGLAWGALRDGRVAVRVPRHDVARALARAAGHAITATSANLSGTPPTDDPAVIRRSLSGLDLLLDGGRAPGGPASTIVDATGGAPVLIRAGAVAWERVLESSGPAPSPP